MEENDWELTPKQDEYIFWKDDEIGQHYLAWMGGVGKGATTAGCHKAMYLSQKYPRNRGLIGRKTFPSLRDTTMLTFEDMYPLKSGRGWKWKESEMKLTLPNKSEILFRHLDNPNLGSLEIGWFYIDQAEEVTEDVFYTLYRRLRLKRVSHRAGFITGNPQGHDWIYDRFKSHPKKNFHLIESTTMDNEVNLPPEYVESLLEMPDRWKRRYVYGSWEEYAGKIYPFREDAHLLPLFEIPKHWPKVGIIDTAVSGITACLWKAMSPLGDNIYFDEYVKEGGTVEEHALAMKQKAAAYEPILYYVIDPSPGKVIMQGNQTKSLRSEYSANGIYTRIADKAVEAGINRVNTLMTVDLTHPNPVTGVMGAPYLYITENMEKTKEAFFNYIWKDLTTSIDKTKEAPVKNDACHLMDAVRYGAMDGMTFKTHKWKQEKRPNPYAFA